MTVAWSPLAIPGVIALVLGFVMAGFVYFTRPDRAQNRWLAIVLALTGSLGFALTSLRLLLPDLESATAAYLLSFVLGAAVAPPYVWFLSTVDAPLARPLKSRIPKAIVAVYGAGLVLLVLARPDLMIADAVYADTVGTWVFEDAPFTLTGYIPLVLTYAYGLLVSLSAVRHAASSMGRAQAKAYAWAFGLNDAMLVILLGPVSVFFDSGSSAMVLAVFVLHPIRAILLCSLLAYGMLRTQLFDVDLRVKRTIRRSTVAGAFAGAFFLASEGIEAVLPVDGSAYGIAAAGAVALALRPVQRVAERVADRVMPNVADTPEYVEARKLEVYRAAVEGGFSDGHITPRERAMLDRLRAQLEIPPHVAAALEAEAARAASRPVTAESDAPAQHP